MADAAQPKPNWPRSRDRRPGIDGFKELDRELRQMAAEGGVLLSQVQPERVSWLWPGRLARGKLTLFDGDPNRGKSVLMIDIVARVSTGRPWPDGAPCPRGGAVILSAEDGLADTIRPRLDAAEGNPECVLALDLVGDDPHPVTLPDDLDYVEAAIRRVGALVVIIDPLMAYLSGDVNSHRDQDVRRALRPLVEVAGRMGVAVAVVRHLNKTSGGPAIYRGGGSIGIIGAARVGLVVGADPEDEELRVLASVKSNLSAPPASLAYRLVEAANGAVMVRWEGMSGLTADQLVAAPAPPESSEDRTALGEACDWLRTRLAAGPVPSRQLLKEATEAGVAKRTLDRAKQVLDVKAKPLGQQQPWAWWLPEFAKDDQSPPRPGVGEHSGSLANSGPRCASHPDQVLTKLAAGFWCIGCRGYAQTDSAPGQPPTAAARRARQLRLEQVDDHGHVTWRFAWEGAEPRWHGHPPGLFASREMAEKWARSRGFRVAGELGW